MLVKCPSVEGLKFIFSGDEFKSYPILKEIGDHFKVIWRNKKKVLQMIREQFDLSLNLPPGRHRPFDMINTYTSDFDQISLKNEELIVIDTGKTEHNIHYMNYVDGTSKKTTNMIYEMSQQVLTGSKETFFKFLAECLRLFLLDNELENSGTYTVIWIFSFPCRHMGFNKAYLNRWTKGVNVKNMQNIELTGTLNGALRKKGLNMTVVALINDTVATLYDCSIIEQEQCDIGLVVGDGLNACYLEKKGNIAFHQGCPLKNRNYILNTEIGGLGKKGILNDYQTSYDIRLDEESLNPGMQIFEKLCSSMYLGEILRLTLMDLVRRGRLMKGKLPERFGMKGAIKAQLLSDLERPENEALDLLDKYLKEHFDVEVSKIEARLIRFISRHISARSVHCVALILAAIIQHIDKENVVIGAGGDLFQNHFNYVEFVTASLQKILPSKYNFKIVVSDSRPVKGAFILASSIAMANEQRRKTRISSFMPSSLVRTIVLNIPLKNYLRSF